jgi:hypothetical protein
VIKNLILGIYRKLFKKKSLYDELLSRGKDKFYYPDGFEEMDRKRKERIYVID